MPQNVILVELMAKKRNRRSQKSSTPGQRPVTADISADMIETGSPRSGKAAAQSRQEVAVAQLEQEYSYVTKDLRRVFLLAVAMFALLIALNLFLS
jgi:hypothetical protein